jgi:hypothetical protein
MKYFLISFMPRKIFIVISLIFSLSTKAQKIKYRDLCNSYWFTSGNDNEFNKADTIKLLKKNILGFVQNTQTNAEDLPNYYQRGNFISIHLKRRGRMNFSTTLTKEWVVQERKGNYTWDFNKKSKAIKFYFDKKLLGEFEIIKIGHVTVKSNFAQQAPLSSQEFILKRLSSL